MENLRKHIILHPSLSLLLGAISGILLASQIRFAAVFACAALAILIFLPGYRELAKFAGSAFLGALSLFSAKHYEAPSSYLRLIGKTDCGAEIVVKINDSLHPGSENDWLEPPRPMTADILRFRFSPDDSWREASGRIALIMRVPPKYVPDLSYGDEATLLGVLKCPKGASFEGDFSYSEFLERKGIKRIFEASSMTSMHESESLSLMGSILELRNYCMEKVCTDLKDARNMGMLAAILFGCKQGIGYEDKQTFIESGMIHIFAVSGMHVGIIALIFLCVFRFIPFKWRYLSLPLAVFAYTATTGFQPSAVRASVMISIWCLFKAFCMATPAMNTIYLSAFIMLCTAPLSLFDPGFQFSFLATAFLILSWSTMISFSSALIEKERLIPKEKRSFVNLLRSKALIYLTASAGTTIAAWLASLPLSLFYQGLLVPCSIPANFLAIPLVWAIFMFSALEFVVQPFPVLPDIAAWILDNSLTAMRLLAEWAASADGSSSRFPAPDGLSILAYYVLLVMFLRVKREFHAALSFALLLSIVLYWQEREASDSPHLYILSGGGANVPVLILCEAGRSSADIVNAPDYDSARTTVNKLKRLGIDKVRNLLFCEGNKDFCAGAECIFKAFWIDRICFPPTWNRSYYGKKAIRSAAENEIPIFLFDNIDKLHVMRSPEICFEGERLKYSFKWLLSGKRLLLRMEKDRSGSWKIEGDYGDAENARLDLQIGNKLKMDEINLFNPQRRSQKQ